jgi:predicted nuclease of predicted toxin-antitoxin system
MKILFDQGTPVPLRRFLHPHHVDTAAELGWSALSNGELITQAERNEFQLLITTDQNLRYQQNLRHRKISILVLKTTSWPRIRNEVWRITEAIQRLPSSGFTELEFT